jgi:type II secretory pathway pseudopilin PulG
MIGVLAILAVLAAVLFPVWVRRIDMATKKQESANLVVVSNALAFYTVRNGAVPAVSDWTNCVASSSMLPAASARANSRRYQRFYFTQSSTSSAVNGMTVRPTNARALVVSMLGGNALNPSTLPDDTEFDVLWNTPDGSLPASGPLASGRAGDDLLIQRVDYAPLFHRLVLVNRDTNNASYAINGQASVTFPGGAPHTVWERYYLDGTAVTLGNGAGGPMNRLVLTRDVGFVFEAGFWHDQIMGMSPSSSSLPDDFAAKAAVFLESPWNSAAKQGGGNTSDQETVLTAMYTFMYTYTLWANQWPHFPYHGAPSATQVPEFEMLRDVADDNAFLDTLTKYLVSK